MARGSRIVSRVGLVLALLLTLAAALAAQVVPPVLTLDLDSARVIGGRIPFDQQFELRGKAPKELVQVTLIMRPASEYPPGRCRPPASSAMASDAPESTTTALAPGDSATWTRHDSRAVFSLQIGPIDAHRSYTLCLRTVTKLSDSATASVQRTVAAGVAEAIRSFFSSNEVHPSSLAMLPELRGALIAALSRIDSAYFMDTTGVYVPFDAAQLSRWMEQYVGGDYNAWYVNLEHVYLQEDPRSFSDNADRLKEELVRLQSALGRLRLDALSRAYERVAPQVQRDRVALAIAASLPNYRPRALYLISRGATPMAAPDLNAPEPVIDGAGKWARRTGAGLAAMRAQLDTMALQLRDLADLASLAARADSSGDVSAVFRALEGARDVLFRLREDARALAEAFDATNAAAARLVPAISTFSVGQIGVLGSAATTYVELSKDYISADLGLVAAPGFPKAFAGGAVQGYVGVNFYLAPVNRDARYGLFCRGHSILKCLSLTVGLTTGSIARPNVRADLFGSHSLFTGIGLRLGSFVRFTVGTLIFQSYTNDSRRAQRITGTFAFALCANWDIKSTLGGLGDILAGK